MEIFIESVKSGWYALLEYLSAHVLTCLVPAFFIAGAIAFSIVIGLIMSLIWMKEERLKLEGNENLIFIGAWSTTKVPMLLFEISALGARFAMTRLAIDIIGIIIAYVLYIMVSKREVKELYYKAENL